VKKNKMKKAKAISPSRMIQRALILPIKHHTYIAVTKSTNKKVDDVNVAIITFIFVLDFGITISKTKMATIVHEIFA